MASKNKRHVRIFERSNSTTDRIGREGAKHCGAAQPQRKLDNVVWNGAKTIRVRQLTNCELKGRLVEHFGILFNFRALYWPTRHGLVPYKEVPRQL